MCFCRAHYLLLAVILALGVMSILTACGARGDLYLPPAHKEQPQNGGNDSTK
jgi:predicted small lipoprotein YifL